MKNVNKSISRRDFVKALGAVGALSSLNVERVLAQSSIAPVRVLVIAIQHGWGICNVSNRHVTGSDGNVIFPAGLEPFNTIKQHATVVDGLLGLGEWGNNHDLSYPDILTAGVPQGEKSSALDKHIPMPVTPSLDYLLQEHSGKETFRFSAGYRSWGLAYHPLSYDRNINILPYYTSATSAYKSIFANLSVDNLNTQEMQNRQFMADLFTTLRQTTNRDISQLSTSERQKLDTYINSIYDLQAKKLSTQTSSGNIALPGAPAASSDNGDNFRDYLEMVKVGFANNITTSAVIGVGELGAIPDFHHTHAHEMTNSYWDTRALYAQYVTNFINDLENIQDADGNTLLDNTIIVLTGEVAHGKHNILAKGHIMFGGGGVDSMGNKRMRPGRIIRPTLLDRRTAATLLREDINGALQQQVVWGNEASERTNADLLREIGNLAGLNLTEFGLPSQNRGSVLL